MNMKGQWAGKKRCPDGLAVARALIKIIREKIALKSIMFSISLIVLKFYTRVCFVFFTFLNVFWLMCFSITNRKRCKGGTFEIF